MTHGNVRLRLTGSVTSATYLASHMPQLSYWEQQWVRMTRLLLGVAAPTRRGGMRRCRRMMTSELNTLRHALSTYGLPRMNLNGEDSSPEDFKEDQAAEVKITSK